MTTIDENALFASWQKAEGVAKDALREELARALISHALSVCWLQLKEYSPEVANWCTQKALQKAARFRGDAKFTTWFHRIVLNACASSLRDKLRQGHKSLDDLPEGALAVGPDSLDARLDLGKISSMLDPEDREFIEMRLRGLEDEAIGAILGLTRSGVRGRWFRIRRRILKLLGT